MVQLARCNILQERKSGGEVKRWVGGCPWAEGGERPKNRRWNTWRPDEEDHSPVAPAALQCHPALSTSCLALSCDSLEQRQAMVKLDEKAETGNKAKQFFWPVSASFPFISKFG